VSESDDLRTFIREITLRFERGIERISRDIRADLAMTREENRRYFEVLDERTRELHAESLAQRQALLHVLDELRGENGGVEPAT
jgi:hypothetical protein